MNDMKTVTLQIEDLELVLEQAFENGSFYEGAACLLRLKRVVEAVLDTGYKGMFEGFLHEVDCLLEDENFPVGGELEGEDDEDIE
jgi:hypothetical protein